jgi:excisionase family DNA binding protein
MTTDKTIPLYALTVGEFVELTRQTLHAVISENPKIIPLPVHDQEEHFSIADCARFLGCSVVSIHNYKKQGMPYYRIGRKVLFKKSEVLAFMKKSMKKAA